MKKGIFQLLLLSSIYILSPIGLASEMSRINFFQKDGISYFEFNFSSSDVEAKKYSNKTDRQIIIDFKDVKAQARVLRGFDASEFEGSVVYLSAYPKRT